MVEVDAAVQQSERLCWAISREEIGNRLPARRHLRERGVKRKASSLHGQLHCSSQNGDGYQKTVNACGFGVPILAAKSTPAAAGTER